MFRMLQVGIKLPNWDDPPPPPPGWIQFIRRLLQTRDLQDHFPMSRASHLRLTSVINECLDNAVFDIQKLLRHLDQYDRNLLGICSLSVVLGVSLLVQYCFIYWVVLV